MTRNMGAVDRTVRLILVAVVAALYARGIVAGTLAIVLGAVGIVFLVTSAIGYCPTYTLVGVSTVGTPARAAR